MEVENLSLGLAFMAGLVSFISPCVLPLVPAYIGYMGGRATTEAGKEERHQFGTFVHGVFFVLGFTFFFVGFGLLTAAASSFLETIGLDIETMLIRLGGAAVVFFGLYVMKAFDPLFRRALETTGRWNSEQKLLPPLILTLATAAILLAYFYWAFGAAGIQSIIWSLILFLLILALFRKPLNEATSLADFWNRAIVSLQVALATDTRRQLDFQKRKQGYVGSFGLGLVFSAGWTPCIGPVYAGVLTLATEAAADGGSLLPAGALLTAYSMGLGIPFLLTALAFNQSTSLMARLKRNMATIERVSGVLLLAIGVLILSGGLTDLSSQIAADGELGEFSFRLEECTAGVFDGRINAGSYPGCVSSGEEKLSDRYISSVKYAAQSDFVFAPAPADVEVGLEVGDRAPDFTLRTLDGEELALSDLRGQAVLVNFWATWCGPCRAEMPHFQEVYELEQRRGFTVLAVNLEESPEQVQGFVDELDLTFPVVLDRDGRVSTGEYRVNSYPTSYLVDGNGIITMVQRGPLSTQDLVDELARFEPEQTQTVARYVFPEAAVDAEVGLEVGDRAPDFTLRTLDGEELALSDLRGQAVLVNFWATWCGPCRAEMPHFQEVYELEQRRGFTVLAVNLEESPEQVQGFVDELDLTFPVVLDRNGRVSTGEYRVNSYPTSYLVDGNGIIQMVQRGPLTVDDLIAELEQFEPESVDPVAQAR